MKFAVFITVLTFLLFGILLSHTVYAAPETCLNCHGVFTSQVQVQEWKTSAHAKSLETLKASPDATDKCLVCHSSDFRSDPKVTLATAELGNTCTACHKKHDAEFRFPGVNQELLKSKKEVCNDCHTAGSAKPGEVPRSAQVEIFAGKGGIDVPDSAGIHSLIMPDGCTTCHTFKADPTVVSAVGGHTFKANVAKCAQCHPANAEQKKADANQQIADLLAKVDPLLEAHANKNSDDFKNAKFNVDLVKVSGDGGVHNLKYSKALLEKSISLLEGGGGPPPVTEETCLACHRGLSPAVVTQWETSAHAKSLKTLKESPEAKDNCLACHSTDYRKDPAKVTLATAQLGNSCTTCHVDHPTQGRPAGKDSELLKPKNELCLNCHSAASFKPGETLRSGQVEIFKGKGGFGVKDNEGIHSRIMVADACVRCHTPIVDAAQAAAGLGHTFKANLAACDACHFDTEARFANAQKEISSRLDKLTPLLDSFKDKNAEAYQQAKFNVELVKIGDPAGVHNLTYSKSLLDFSASVLETPAPTFPAWDVNKDGQVNIFDLVIVGGQFGQSGAGLSGDVNGDGKINIFDLVLVGSHFGEKTAPAAAPSVLAATSSPIEVCIELKPYRQGRADLLIAEITGNFDQNLYGYQFDLEFDPAVMELIATDQGSVFGKSTEDAYWYAGQINNQTGRWSQAASTLIGSAGKVQTRGTLAGVTFRMKRWSTPPELLIRLANVRLVDSEARLLPYQLRKSILGEYLASRALPQVSKAHPNFPNPFNPETWMPYELATPSHVEISIYNTMGQLVRRLDLGHREAGVYLDRQSAAFWDGRSDSGEPVASGVYYYQIKAGDFAETRKMILRK